ncbi:hypothetical protein MRX96_055165 [Rhipicephalus microplus]
MARHSIRGRHGAPANTSSAWASGERESEATSGSSNEAKWPGCQWIDDPRCADRYVPSRPIPERAGLSVLYYFSFLSRILSTVHSARQ